MGKSICNKCGAIEDDMDAGFSPAAHGMMHECGGKWEKYDSEISVEEKYAVAPGASQKDED